MKIAKFMGQVKTEMGKVAWPSKNELITSTVVVLIATFLMAIYIGVCDVVLSKFLNILLSGMLF